LTIEAKNNKPVRIKWINELVDANGNYLPHLLPVDQTLHWANPPGGVNGRDSRPEFADTPGSYTGPVPTVPHVHGAVGVGAESDGYAEAWYLPAANNIPAGYATEGTWYSYFAGKALTGYGETWGPGFATFQYPNHNRASTIWYHDHALGMTRLNVYAVGWLLHHPGGLRMSSSIHASARMLCCLVLPALGDLPGTLYYSPHRHPDRSFNADGSLFYPDTRAFFDEFAGPYIPISNVSPIWNPEFFGNMIMVNGNTWPVLNVEQRRYRFRFLNGCQSRFLILDFNQIPGVEVWQIGNEGGFLSAPVNLTATNGNRLLMGLAERADLIVDFTNVTQGYKILANVGPDEPFGGGVPGEDFTMADPDSTGQIMAFNVGPAVAPDPSTPPQFLVLPALAPLPAPLTTSAGLIEMMSEVPTGLQKHVG
jgi:FtsP/CotA-like multicopper oxidase with cupredoxin domain